MKKITITLATLALACFTLSASNRSSHDGRPDDNPHRPEQQKPEKPQKPEGTKLHASGRNNCPVYYGCPAPAPSPAPGGGAGGGGKQPGEPQKPGLQV